MKECPICGNVVRRHSSRCPYCGHKFPGVDSLFNALWRIILIAILLVLAFLVVINIWNFSLV